MAEHPGREHAGRMLREGGYSRHKDGDIHEDHDQDEKMTRSAMHQHDQQLHGGKHTKLKLKSGGKVHGKEADCRPDKRARGGEIGQTHGLAAEHREETVGAWKPAQRAAGGRVHGGKKVVVNVHAAPTGDPQREAQAAQMGRQQGIQLGARAAAQRLAGAGGGGGMPPPRPPMAPGAGGPPGMMPPGGAAVPPPRPPMGGAPGGPPGMMARGGGMARDGMGRFTGGRV